MKLLHLAIFQLCFLPALAQETEYSARVVGSNNAPLPGANIIEIGSENYAISNGEGVFTISIDTPNFTLRISSVGFETREIEVVNGNLPDTIIMEESTRELDEVVVTALGIEKEKQSLASSVSNVSSDQLTAVPETNLVNSLAGKVAGVQTTHGSSGVGSSSRIIIRGENSLSGNNQPLFVMDGIPIRNQLIGSDLVNDGSLQEVDFGNGAAELNPADIASMSILKGPGSAALYGSRAANGVVLITTKDGQKHPGLNISTSSTFTVESLLTLPDYQNKYGSGANGKYSFKDGKGGGVNDGGISSYGPELDQGQMIKQFDSPSEDVNGNPVRGGDIIARTRPDGSMTEIEPTPWVSRPDNVRNFFETGFTSQQNIAVSKGGEKGSTRLSYSNMRNDGMLPNTGLKRDGIAISLDQQLSEKLSVDFYGNYINSRSKNRPNLGYGYENVMYGFNWTGRQTDINALRDYWQADQEGEQHFDFNYLWLTNPYLTLFENTNSFNKNRVLGNGSVTYDFNNNLSLRIRSGADIFNDNREFRRAFSTNRKPFGGYREDDVIFREINSDLLLLYNNRINESWQYEAAAGAYQFDQQIEYSFSEAGQLAVPGVYTLDNAREPLTGTSQKFNQRTQSLYGFGNLTFRNTIYLNLNVRNDWSSTLPTDNNSYAYYSSGLSFIPSNIIKMPGEISYTKLRLSAASVGNGTEPYQLENTFQFNQNYGSYFRVTNRAELKNSNLKPERLNAFEAGAEFWFFNDRLQLDVSAYQNTSINQIIGRPISTTSGYSRKIENGGEVRTRGIETKLRGEMIQKNNFQWLSFANFSRYRSVVTRLPEGVDQYVTGRASIFSGDGGTNTVFYIAREGGRVSDMYGTGFVQINGETLFGSNGLPVRDEKLRRLGSYNPEFTLGFNNEFRYKHFSLSILMDWRHGGTIVSRTKALGMTSGVLQESLEGREDGVVGDGVMNAGTMENPEYIPNTTSVNASQFYNNFYDRGNEASALYDASYLKLRQVSLYYDFPEEFSQKLGFQKLKLGFVGSNLLLFTENPHFDPELNAMQGPNLTYGVEDMAYPSSRSYGISLKTSF